MGDELRCANCGKPNPTITGGHLTDGEAVCSERCYRQIGELGCPHEQHDGYRHPADRGGLPELPSDAQDIGREVPLAVTRDGQLVAWDSPEALFRGRMDLRYRENAGELMEAGVVEEAAAARFARKGKKVEAEEEEEEQEPEW